MICRSSEVQYLKLLVVEDNYNRNIEKNMSIAKTLILLHEPLDVNSIITFGIEGDCILKELIVNASIDNIYGNNIIVCF